MVLIESHSVPNVPQNRRFVDYAIGIFERFTTRNAVKKAIIRGELHHNGKPAKTGTWIQPNDQIDWVDPEKHIPKAYPIDIPIVYEDDFFAVVLKPSGLVTSGNQHATLVNALIGKLKDSSQKDAYKWGRPVHRLDAATSGLVIVAKAANAHQHIQRQFEQRTIHKTYHAVVQGDCASSVVSTLR